MLAVCLKDGLTVGETVLRKGDVFKLPAIIEAAVATKSDDQLARYQKRVYGEPVFRRPSNEELVKAFYHGGRAKFLEQCDDKEKQIIRKRLTTSVEKKKQAADVLFEEETKEDLDDLLEEAEDAVVNPVGDTKK